MKPMQTPGLSALLALLLSLPACAGATAEAPPPEHSAPPALPQAVPQAAPPAAPSSKSQGFAPEGLARITRVLREKIAAGRIPGGVLMIARNGQVVLEEAIGVRDPSNGAPMQKDAIFRIFSMTKPIVSAGVMMLVEEGKVQLSDRASKYFPELRELKVGIEKPGKKGEPTLELVPAQREMTVQDLLRHTSGLTYGIFGKSLVKNEYLKLGVDGRDTTNAGFIERLAKAPLHFEPGTTWEYSRSTDVLGVLIERVSGQTLDVYLKQRIFDPLKMNDTAFAVEAAKQARIAEPFAVDPDTKEPIKLVDVRQMPTLLSGGGGLVSTARDYMRFAQAMLNGGALDGARILSPHTVKLMTADHLGTIRGPRYAPGPGYGFGLGFAVRIAEGEAIAAGNVGEYTWGGFAGTGFWVDPREKVIAVWMMQAPSQLAEFRSLVRTLTYGAIAE